MKHILVMLLSLYRIFLIPAERKRDRLHAKWIFAMQRIANEVYPVRCQFEIHCPLNSANELTYEKLCITYLKEYMKYCKSHEGWDPNEKYARLIAFMELFSQE